MNRIEGPGPMQRSDGARFVFSGIGTSGDILPLLSLAGEMVARGHECHLLAPEPFEADARSRGVHFTPIASQEVNNLAGFEHCFARYIVPSYAPTLAFFKATCADLRPTVVVNLDNFSATNLLCELHGLPMCRVHLAPYGVRSVVSPPLPWKSAAEGPLGHAFRTYTLPAIHASWDTNPFALGCINAYRGSSGLSPTRSLYESEKRIGARLALFPKWFSSPAADWPENLRFLGFPLERSRSRLPDALAAWLDRRDRPLVFTPGTGTCDVAEFFAHAARCCDELGRPGLFLSPHLAGARRDYGPNILPLAYVDLDLILERSALIVHHGGVGTAARALQAGIPQIISPLAHDQPDNGYRVSRLGAGSVLERPALSGVSLARAATALFGDPGVARQLATIQKLLQSQRTLADCADLLERQVVPRTARAPELRVPQPRAASLPRLGTPSCRVSSPRFVFAGTGTRGDVLPLCGVARELVRRGYECHLLANEPFAAEALTAGIHFTPVTCQQSNETPNLEYNFATYLFPSYAPTHAFFERAARDGRQTVVVNLDDFSASNWVAEAFDLPVCRIHLAPFKLPSLVAPPAPFTAAAEGPLARTFLKYTLPAIYDELYENPFAIQTINQHRKRWGLSPIASTREAGKRVQAHLAFFPRWYCKPAADWPRELELLGFPLPKSSSQIPSALAAFIEREGAPLVFTPGTGVPDVEELFLHAQRCCDELQMPGVFLSPYLEQSERHGSRIIHFGYLDLDLVLGRAALLVHHGGIGTTARALQAGIPQIISPLAYDQPDNGARVVRLGAGAVVERARLSGAELAKAARELLASQKVTRRLAAIRELMRRNDALSACATTLERHFARGRADGAAVARAR